MTVRIFLCSMLLIFALAVWAQNPGVAINTSAQKPDKSAILDVSSNTKGVLITRMSTQQRLAINQPAVGLMVYDSTVSCLCIYSGARWKMLCEDSHVNEGLLAYYKFDGNFADSSGNNLHAVAYGNPNFGTDRNGIYHGALNFDGYNDFLQVNDNGILNVPSISISFWIKTGVTGQAQDLLSRHNFDNATNLSWVTGISAANSDVDFTVVPPYLCGTVPAINSTDVLYSNQTIDPERWFHVVCIFNKGIQKIYVGGQLKKSMKRDFNSLPTCSSQLIIGSWWDGDKAFFNGLMDEVRIYNRELNDLEIEELSVMK